MCLSEALHRTLHLEFLCSGFDQGLSHLQSRSSGCKSGMPFRGWVRWGQAPHQRGYSTRRVFLTLSLLMWTEVPPCSSTWGNGSWSTDWVSVQWSWAMEFIPRKVKIGKLCTSRLPIGLHPLASHPRLQSWGWLWAFIGWSFKSFFPGAWRM